MDGVNYVLPLKPEGELLGPLHNCRVMYVSGIELRENHELHKALCNLYFHILPNVNRPNIAADTLKPGVFHVIILRDPESVVSEFKRHPIRAVRTFLRRSDGITRKNSISNHVTRNQRRRADSTNNYDLLSGNFAAKNELYEACKDLTSKPIEYLDFQDDSFSLDSEAEFGASPQITATNNGNNNSNGNLNGLNHNSNNINSSSMKNDGEDDDSSESEDETESIIPYKQYRNKEYEMFNLAGSVCDAFCLPGTDGKSENLYASIAGELATKRAPTANGGKKKGAATPSDSLGGSPTAQASQMITSTETSKSILSQFPVLTKKRLKTARSFLPNLPINFPISDLVFSTRRITFYERIVAACSFQIYENPVCLTTKCKVAQLLYIGTRVRFQMISAGRRLIASMVNECISQKHKNVDVIFTYASVDAQKFFKLNGFDNDPLLTERFKHIDESEWTESVLMVRYIQSPAMIENYLAFDATYNGRIMNTINNSSNNINNVTNTKFSDSSNSITTNSATSAAIASFMKNSPTKLLSSFNNSNNMTVEQHQQQSQQSPFVANNDAPFNTGTTASNSTVFSGSYPHRLTLHDKAEIIQQLMEFERTVSRASRLKDSQEALQQLDFVAATHNNGSNKYAQILLENNQRVSDKLLGRATGNSLSDNYDSKLANSLNEKDLNDADLIVHNKVRETFTETGVNVKIPVSRELENMAQDIQAQKMMAMYNSLPATPGYDFWRDRALARVSEEAIYIQNLCHRMSQLEKEYDIQKRTCNYLKDLFYREKICNIMHSELANAYESQMAAAGIKPTIDKEQLMKKVQDQTQSLSFELEKL